MKGSLLVGDIGGTHSRFGLVDGASRPERVGTSDDDDFATFEDAVAAYLDAQAGATPARATFAIAAPVSGRRVTLTNRDWTIDADALERRFGIDRVDLVNDFVAQAACLPHLEPHEVAPIGDVPPVADVTKVALGPGTGLGVAALARDADRWVPLPSEGGHVGLAAADDRQAAILAEVRRECGRAEAEHLLSGPGLSRLHRTVTALAGAPADQASPPEIVERARKGEPRSRETVDLFLAMLASFAGDVALTFGARGGVYFCGGVAPRLLPFVDAGSFRAAFENKRPHERLMRETATSVVVTEAAGLLGCAAIARRN